MDLEAASIANAKAWRFTRLGMVACFVLAGLLLVVSLTMARASAPEQFTTPLPQAPRS